MNKERILILSPHTDDGELGCGGTIARFVREGKKVYYVAFAYPKGSPEGVLKDEMLHALSQLGVTKHFIGNEETRRFPESRQRILDLMIDIEDEFQPDLVLLPSRFDQHQDHQVICQEGFRAFKHCSILGYEEPWNNVTFKTDTFIGLSQDDVDKKVKALSCYKSQQDRAFFSESFTRSMTITRGVQAGTNHAEAFETIRWII